MTSSGAPVNSPAVADAAPQPVGPPPERRISLPPYLLREGSLMAAELGGLGLGSMSLGSQDLAGLLDSTLQHMQTLPRLELDLLASPKWKALLSWEEESSPIHLDTAGSSATRVPPHCALDGDSDAAPVSPGVDQEVGGVALEASWSLPQAASGGRSQLRGHGHGQSAEAVLIPLGLPQGPSPQQHHQHHQQNQQQQQQQQGEEKEEHPQPQEHRPRGFGGKKRPAGHAEDSPAQKQPKRETASPEEQHQQQSPAVMPQRHLISLTSGDAMMLDAEVAAVEAAVAAAAFDAAAAAEYGSPPAGLDLGRREDTSTAIDVASRLNIVRLNSLGSSPLQHRRLTAAAAAAAVTPAGRRGRVQRGDSNMPLLMAELPGSPTAGAAQLLPNTVEEPVATGSSASAPAGTFNATAAATPIKQEAQAPALPASSAAAAPAPAAAAGPPIPSWAKPAPMARQQLPSKSHKAVATGENGVFTSPYRGVTRHRLTGRYEAHFWDSSYVRPNVKKGGRTRGRQVYLGGYETELEAARAYDRAVIAYNGSTAPLNFPPEDYADDLAWIQGRSPEEVVGILRRGSVGFARGQSTYRGVTRHHQAGKWEARIGRVQGNKYLYLGTFDSAEDAARAYDRACVKYRGAKAILNFDLSHYQQILDDPDAYDPLAAGGANSYDESSYCSGGSGTGFAGGGGGSRGCRSARSAPLAAPTPVRPSSALPGGGFMMSPEAAAAAASAAAAAMAGGSSVPGTVFLPLMQPMQLPLGVQQQFGVHLSMQQNPWMQHLHLMPDSSPAAAAAAGPPCLPAIRTCGIAAAAGTGPAMLAGSNDSGRMGLSGGSTPSSAVTGSGGNTPGSAVTGSAGLDLSDILLSPLAASLLSPLGLSGTPRGWRDSPLGRLATGELNRLLSGVSPTGLQSPSTGTGRHRLHHTSGFTPVGGESGGSGGPASRLQSTGSELDLLAALQWLDSLDPAQLATLAAMEPSHTAAEGGSGGQGGSQGASSGASGSGGSAGAGHAQQADGDMV